MLTLLLLALMHAPLIKGSIPACMTETREEADLVARQVTSVQDANWCVFLVSNCGEKHALLLIYKEDKAEQSYVLSKSCRK